MYDNLRKLGITQPEEIDSYSLRQEANNDILKIYFRKDKGELFAKSVKFKYPVNHHLDHLISELDHICQPAQPNNIDFKRKVLDDLRHLESVVANKIAEIEETLEKIPRGR